VTRVKRSVHAKKKRRETLERAKGFRGEAHSNYKRAKEALMKADAYAYRDRRNRKRDFRRLWITRINAAARINGMSWLEYGFYYATVISKDSRHELTGGIGVKYLQGVGAAYLKNTRLNYTIHDTTQLILTHSNLDYGRADYDSGSQHRRYAIQAIAPPMAAANRAREQRRQLCRRAAMSWRSLQTFAAMGRRPKFPASGPDR